MKIVVLLKQTPDTETKIKLNAAQNGIETADVKWIINPYDEFAIEEALKLKEAAGSGEVVIVSMGSDATRELIVKALAMGADRGVLIDHTGLEQCDSLVFAKVLAAVIKAEAPQMVFCGKQAIDDDNMHVGPMVAELIGWPHVNVVTKLSVSGSKATAEREVEGGQVEVYEVTLPAVLGAHKSLNTPRYASLPGIMKAKKKPLDKKTCTDYGLDLSKLQSSIKCRVKKFKFPPEKPAGKVFKGEDVAVMVAKVAKLLREEAKVI